MKTKKISVLIGIIALVALVIGSSMAYFAASYTMVGTPQRATLSTKAVTTVVYNSTSAINLTNANPGDSATANFNIVMNVYTPIVESKTYNIVWTITNNTFTGTGELLYTLQKSNDNSTWTNVATDVDCTSFTGNNTIAASQIISGSNSVASTTYWRLTITFVNKNVDQNNMNANLTGYLSVTGL